MKYRSTFISAFVIGVLSIRLALMASASMMTMNPLRERLRTLISTEEISEGQYDTIVRNFTNDDLLDAQMTSRDSLEPSPLSRTKAHAFSNWLDNMVAMYSIPEDTADYLRVIFRLGPSYVHGGVRTKINKNDGPVEGDYIGNGLVELFAWSDFGPAKTGIYNGIWGYSTGDREYALQATGAGLDILDVTTSNIVKVQTILMSGGNDWRDVVTDSHYAYVAAQYAGNATLWAIDLSQLSNNEAQLSDSNPITLNNIRDIGYTNWGHTLNAWEGLLFMNSARWGCKIFDLKMNPMDPKELHTYTRGDCHDSVAKSMIYDGKLRDIMFVADGGYGRYRSIDITNIRNPDFKFTRIGQTPKEYYAYAHQNVVTDDGDILFVSEESNNFHMAAYDITDLTDPKLITKFQFSEHPTYDARVHNVHVQGNYLMAAYYCAGLRIFDISDIHNIIEVGKYETYRDPNGDAVFENNNSPLPYTGSWNIHGGLPSGKVLISDTNYGTFVVNIGDPLPLAPVLTPSSLPSISSTKLLTNTPTNSPTNSLTKSQTNSPTNSPTNSLKNFPKEVQTKPDTKGAESGATSYLNILLTFFMITIAFLKNA